MFSGLAFGEDSLMEPNFIIISPAWNDAIMRGKSICPCHADYRHKRTWIEKIRLFFILLQYRIKRYVP